MRSAPVYPTVNHANLSVLTELSFYYFLRKWSKIYYQERKLGFGIYKVLSNHPDQVAAESKLYGKLVAAKTKTF